MTDPITREYLDCLEEYGNSKEHEFLHRGLVFPTNDEIIRSIFRHEGRREVFAVMRSPVDLMTTFNKIEEDKEDGLSN